MKYRCMDASNMGGKHVVRWDQLARVYHDPDKTLYACQSCYEAYVKCEGCGIDWKEGDPGPLFLYLVKGGDDVCAKCAAPLLVEMFGGEEHENVV